MEEERQDPDKRWLPFGVPSLLRQMSERRSVQDARRAALWWLPLSRELPLAMIAVDKRGVVVLWNNTAERMFGWRRGEVIGRVVPLAEPFSGSSRQPRKDGMRIAVSGWTLPLRGRRNEVLGQIALLADRTVDDAAGSEREERIRLLERRLDRERWLGRSTRTLAGSLDRASTIATLVRLCVPELADACFVDRWEPADGALDRLVVEAEPSLTSALENGSPRRGSAGPLVETALGGAPVLVVDEVKQRLLDGVDDDDARRAIEQLAPVSVLCAPLVVHGRTIGVLTLVHGSSGRRHDRADVEAAEALAAAAALAIDNSNRYTVAEAKASERGENLATASHDLKNPLLGLRIEAERMLRELPDQPELARMRDGLGRMIRLSQHMKQLVTQLLDFTMLESGRAQIDLQTLPAVQLLDEAVDAFSPIADAQHVTLEREAPVEADLQVRCDRVRVWQVLSNLIGNAVKHGQGGRVVLSVERRGEYAVFAVSDDGRGLGPAALQEALDAPSDRRARGGSTGLGLIISRRIVEAHGGWLRAESEPGRGSRFCFSLPVAT